MHEVATSGPTSLGFLGAFYETGPTNRWEDYALVITIVRASESEPAGAPSLDWPWKFGVGVIIVQIVLSTIPGIIYNSWSCFVITMVGTILSLAHGSLIQWRQQKWPCRTLKPPKASPSYKGKNRAVILTQSNRGAHALVIISEGTGRDQDLTSSPSSPSLMSRMLPGLWLKKP